MELRAFKTLWGHGGNLADAVAACREHGSTASKASTPPPGSAANFPECSPMRSRLHCGICTAGGYVPDRHAPVSRTSNLFRRQAEAAVECCPLFLTVIAVATPGAPEQSVDFFGQAIAIAATRNPASSKPTAAAPFSIRG